MLEIDKTDFRWNGKLSGAVNNLYYDLINVDVTRVPYSRTHRNSSFFFKTRLWYIPYEDLIEGIADEIWTTKFWVTDIKVLWEENCDKENGVVFMMIQTNHYKHKWIFTVDIEEWCIVPSTLDLQSDFTIWSGKCWDWKFFTTDFANWEAITIWWWETGKTWTHWIQINVYENWNTVWYFSADAVEWWVATFDDDIEPWDYLVVTKSKNRESSWFAWQVRMITQVDTATGRLLVDAPWLWFKTPSRDDIEERWTAELYWDWLTYRIFRDWWDVVGYSRDNDIYLLSKEWTETRFQDVWWNASTSIVWVADSNDKIFVLTDNWYVHYNHDTGWYNKFFINDAMMAWPDKTSIVAYRDFILAFWHRHISVWVPDEQSTYYTMYNQSTSIWVWSRYSYAEYEWDLIFVSNDKRLLALWISATAWRYMLQHEDVWEMLNGKLATMFDSDEVYVWSYNNNLRVFVLTKWSPYEISGWEVVEDDTENNMTHIYKFDTLFKVWTEDHFSWLMTWVHEWLWYWRNWIYTRWLDNQWRPYDKVSANSSKEYVKAQINAYMLENENNWIEWQPDLFSIAKLNRLITTLWPWVYSDNTKIHIQSYIQWVWINYEFPIWTPDWTINNQWIDNITKSYIWEDSEIPECLLDAIKDSQTQFTPCATSSRTIKVQTLIPDKPWCDWDKEYMMQEHWTCINDELYTFAPTMPLVAELGENQSYSSEIKIEIISEEGDIMTFGWFLAELFIAPVWYKWPDWEYQIKTKTDC